VVVPVPKIVPVPEIRPTLEAVPVPVVVPVVVVPIDVIDVVGLVVIVIKDLLGPPPAATVPGLKFNRFTDLVTPMSTIEPVAAVLIMPSRRPVDAVDDETTVDDADAGGSVFIAAVAAGTDACTPWLRAIATSSLRRTRALTPRCSLWTQRVNSAPVGAVLRIDSYNPITTWPAWLFARFLAAGCATSAPCALRPAAERSTRSSRHEVAPETEGI
jgi:hypothetical protein